MLLIHTAPEDGGRGLLAGVSRYAPPEMCVDTCANLGLCGQAVQSMDTLARGAGPLPGDMQRAELPLPFPSAACALGHTMSETQMHSSLATIETFRYIGS